MPQFDVIIIGGGVVGLASAFKILENNPALKLCVLEKEKAVAQHQSGHNSGVIHSGIYYKPGSQKAKNCRRGYRLLLDFCETHDIRYKICGKLIVATDLNEVAYLDVLFERGCQNGLQDLRRLSGEEIREFEPYARGVSGVFVPQTGVVNFVDVADQLLNDIQELGAEVHVDKKVTQIRNSGNHVEIMTSDKTFTSKFGVNCAGLFSDRIARLSKGNLALRIIPFRGEYYKLTANRSYLVNSLIYPVPNPEFPFLGVHFTRTIDGSVEAGPNAVLALHREGYRKSDVNLRDVYETLFWPGFLKVAKKYWKVGLEEMYRSIRKKAFLRALQRLLPEIGMNDLEPAGTGVRAQACHRESGLLDDFALVSEPGFLHVCNAPSPAATSCLAIGESIARQTISAMN